ncbi:MAG: hypothetical protein A3H97_20050 [Acidobacteria bacterium RIFCSPLOWO2_02_FULL_65_29]|nr:MAG: hypothetical protein A3H97_20050 [Acidobacteria bacterium RIFCSPLOWO2_02_FULL_65_29]
MTTSRQILGFSQTFVALAVAAAFSPAHAQEGGDIAQLTEPGSSISLGLGLATGDSKDRARFGMFNGLRKHDVNGLLGFNYLNRDGASGRWLTIEGRNLGLDNRELGFSYRRLGDLKFTADYSEITRHDPRTINTSLQGAGTTTPTVSLLAVPGTGQDLNLELKRKGLGFTFEKRFGDTLQLEVNFKNEDKDGARFFGKGFACSSNWQAVGACSGSSGSAILMLPEPVDSTIRQLDAKLNYSGERLKLSGGYYGSFYTNHNGTLRPTILGGFGNQNGGLQAANANLATTMGLPMALWPDNQAHQLFVAGNYAVTPKTRVNFKYAYAHATQNENFGGMGLTGAPGGRSDLGGVITTTRAQVGFSSHPLDKLHVHGDLSYQEKKNKTPIDLYNVFYFNAPPVTTGSFTNGNQSPKKYDAKLEASYKLPKNFLLHGGLKYESEDFGTFTPTEVAGGVSGLRQKLAETGYRVELRKMMSETLTGAVSYVSSRREGKSRWLRPFGLPATGVLEASADCPSTGSGATINPCVYRTTAIFPFIFENRNRDKVRLLANWTPAERLSLQLFLDNGWDKYRGPTEHGLRTTKSNNVSVDAAYTLSDNWKLTAYASRGRQTVDAGHSTGYDGILQDTATSLGVGVVGTPTGRLRLGGDLVWIGDKLVYQQMADPLASATNANFLMASGGLPDVTYRLTRLNLYGEYAVQKNAYVRLDFIHHRTFFNEWTYNWNGIPFLYSDNTTLNAQQKQSVTFIGASYVYKFQ